MQNTNNNKSYSLYLKRPHNIQMFCESLGFFFSFKIIYPIFLFLNYFLFCLLSLYQTYFTFKFEAFFRKEKKGNLPYFRPWHQAICIRCINENLTYYEWDTYKMWTVDFIMLFGILLTFCISKCLAYHGTSLICIQVKNM